MALTQLGREDAQARRALGGGPAKRDPLTELSDLLREYLEKENGLREERQAFKAQWLQRWDSLVEAGTRQSNLLERIELGTKTLQASARRVEDLLGQIPRVADAQRETMVSVSRQLDTLHESSNKEAETIAGLATALDGLTQSNTALTDMLRSMQAEGRAREERFVGVVERESRRLQMLAWIVVGLAGAAIAAAVFSALV